MICYLNDNLLKVHRIVNLDEYSYCPAREDGIATIDASKIVIDALYANKINFTLEFGVNEIHPEFIKTYNLLDHPSAIVLGTCMIPVYWKPASAVYDVEYVSSSGELKYKSNLSLSVLESGFQKGLKIKRIFSETGLTPSVLAYLDMKLHTKGKFRYAAPIKAVAADAPKAPKTLPVLHLVDTEVSKKKKLK